MKEKVLEFFSCRVYMWVKDKLYNLVHINWYQRNKILATTLFTRIILHVTLFTSTLFIKKFSNMGTKINNTDGIKLLESDVSKMREEAEIHQVEVAMKP